MRYVLASGLVGYKRNCYHVRKFNGNCRSCCTVKRGVHFNLCIGYTNSLAVLPWFHQRATRSRRTLAAHRTQDPLGHTRATCGGSAVLRSLLLPRARLAAHARYRAAKRPEKPSARCACALEIPTGGTRWNLDSVHCPLRPESLPNAVLTMFIFVEVLFVDLHLESVAAAHVLDGSRRYAAPEPLPAPGVRWDRAFELAVVPDSESEPAPENPAPFGRNGRRERRVSDCFG